MPTIFFIGIAAFLGYQLGFVRGYEKKETDDRDAAAFWKDVKDNGL